MSLPFTLYLINNKCRISIDVKVLNSQVNGFFNAQDACFIFSYVVRAFKSYSSGERNVVPLRSYNDGPNSFTISINSTIKHQSPLAIGIWPFIDQWLFTVFCFQIHNLFIREIKLNWLVIIKRLTSKMLSKDTSFDCFLSFVHNIIFRQQHLPTCNLSSNSRLFKDVLDWIHSGYQPSCMIHHIMTQAFGSPS